MRIAICARDRDERYALSRMTEEALLRHGVLPEISLFSMPHELLEAAARQKEEAFGLTLVVGPVNANTLRSMCGKTRVVYIGIKREGVVAFDVGAGYFLEAPVTAEKLDKALKRCLDGPQEAADKA